MLKKLTIKHRMYLILILIVLMFGVMVYFSMANSNKIRDLALVNTGAVMLEGQKGKLKLAVESLAVAIGKSVENISDHDERVEKIRKELDDIRYEEDKSGYFFVYQETKNIAYPVAKEKEGKDFYEVKDKNGVYVIRELYKQAKAGGGYVTYIWPKPGTGDAPKLSYSVWIPGTKFWIGTGVYIDNIDTQKAALSNEIGGRAKSMLMGMIGISGIIFVIIIALVVLIVVGISRGLWQMIENVKDIAQGEGDLTKRLKIKSGDELGELAKWFNTFLDKLQDIIRQLAKESAGVGQASTQLSEIAEVMTKSIQETSSQADRVAQSTEEMSGTLRSVAAAMDESSNNANIVASASEEMNSTIGEISSNAEKTRAISEDAANKTIEAGEKMESLNEAARSIGQITETITDISNQTNLLALNATIEAARAGEAGKGFAVVAGEIKDLANQTANATEDIKAQIENVQNVSTSSIQSIKEVINVINSAKEMVSTIAAAVSQQSSATQEISSNIEQLSLGIQEVNENVGRSSEVSTQISEEIDRINASSTEMLNTSATVKNSSAEMSALAENLKKIVDSFIIESK